ncbi:HBS1 protein [Gracilaria domingensis]|nr:HBS1 protein [Gracilaria domingensis]
MSRHRHIRNLRYDDYMDDDYYDDDYYEEEEEEEPPAYEEQQDAESPEDLFENLVKQFRLHLQDETLSAAEVDSAITAANYDIDQALKQIQRQREGSAELEQKRLAELELKTPSDLGQLVSDGSERRALPLPPESEVNVNDLELSGFSTVMHLTPPSQWNTKPYNFEDPSPDDAIFAKKKKASQRIQSIRFPKASALRGSSSKSGSVGQKPVREKLPSEKQPKPSSSDAPKRQLDGSKTASKSSRRQKPDTKKHVGPEKQPEVQRTKKIDFSQKVKKGSTSIPVVIAGHVDAGKSTLLGQLLKQVKSISAGQTKTKRRRALQDIAWETDEDGVERERGVTIDIATRVFDSHGRKYALIDAPGHRDFVPAMILGASQASAAILVVDSSPGEFESGFSENGQTREHALVLKALGISRLIVVVNKMDMVSYSKERYMEVTKKIQSYLGNNGWKTSKSVSFVAASGREGINLTASPDRNHPLSQWYTGNPLLGEMEKLETVSISNIEADSQKTTRYVVSDFFKSASLGGDGAVTGRLICGSIAPKDRLALCPGGATVAIKAIELASGERTQVAVAGVDCLPISLGLQNLTEGLLISPGNVLCDPQRPVPVVTKFRAQLITTSAHTVILQGTFGVLHIGGGAEAASITRLIEFVQTKRGGRSGKKRTPRRLVKGDSAIVEINCERGVAMETSSEVKGLGRFAFRQNGITLAVGLVQEIVQTSGDVGKDKTPESAN